MIPEKWKFALDSMTEYELNNIEETQKNDGRVSRISNGCGMKKSDIRKLFRQYKFFSKFLDDK
jgi:signal recognition particle GTPase